jgi:hypothetical protein
LATSLAPILQAMYTHAMTANESRKVFKSKPGSLARVKLIRESNY